MTDSDPGRDIHGQRTLAAILFTDVAGYSARMQEDEDHTLQLVQRDMAFMTGVCERAEGRVLKSTGDGLLMYFTSAVNAVRCALEIQRHFAQDAETSEPRSMLQHRVGIHLGDVFLDGSDVMGDGVNIAARIQAEAEPGGICVSQTVYDVVKNRIGVQTTYLGPRTLRNIRDAVPVYRILLAAQNGLEGGGAAEARSGSKLPRPFWLAGAAVAAIAVTVGIWLAVRPSGGKEPPAVKVGTDPSQPLAGLHGSPAIAGKNPLPNPAGPIMIEFATLPRTKADFDRLYQEHGKTPEGAAATFVAALLLWENDAEAASKCMLDVLSPSCRDPSGRLLATVRAQFRRFARRPHMARSYIVGTKPANNYRMPPPPYRIAFARNERSMISADRAKVSIVASRAVRPRPVVLSRGSEGLWQVEKMSSLAPDGAKRPSPRPRRRPFR